MGIQNDIIWRSRLVYLLMVIFGGLILGKALWVMTIEGKKWREKALAVESVRSVAILPNRGDICAEDGRILATSVPYYELRFDPLAVKRELFQKQVDSLAYCLSRFFKDGNPAFYRNKLIRARQGKKPNRYLLINRRKVNYNELKQIRNFPIFRLGRHKGGFQAILSDKRIQPHRNLAVRTIGYLSESKSGAVEGTVGLESAYENYLKGKNGIGIVRIMPGSRMTFTEQEPIDGFDVMTTINVDYQDIVQHALYKQLEKSEATHGTAILMEVKTGDIKAIANLTKDATGKYRESLNFAISGAGEPGSVIKAASMIALLEDGYVEPQDSIDLGKEGEYKFFDRTMHESHGGLGKITVAQMIEKSSNGISKLVYDKYKDNPAKFVNRWYAMGLNDKTGITLPGEIAPEIKHPSVKENWTGVTLPWMSVGYELKITPLQILAFYNAIANGGQRMRPRLVKEIRSRGELVESFAPEEIGGKICSSSTLRKIRGMLEGVVKNGTAKNIYTDHYSIAGKTGTARLAIKGKYRGGYRASFVGYFPADRPLYSCVIVIDNPSNGYYATTVSAPVFREIADKVYSMAYVQYAQPEYENETKLPVCKNGLKYDFETILNELDMELEGEEQVEHTDWVITVSNEGEKMKMKPRKVDFSIVPNVRGMGLRDALYLLENAGLQVGVLGSGMVQKQSLEPGGKVKKGSYIQIELK